MRELTKEQIEIIKEQVDDSVSMGCITPTVGEVLKEALNPPVVRHSDDMVVEEFVYRNGFRFQRMQKDGMWYVTYQNYIITHGQYRHDLEEWIDSNYA